MITLDLEIKEVEMVLQAVAQMPYAQVAGLMMKMQRSAQEQVQAQQQPQGELADRVIE